MTCTCLRCGYVWDSASGNPATCAKQTCRSPYWNKPVERVEISEGRKGRSIYTPEEPSSYILQDEMEPAAEEGYILPEAPATSLAEADSKPKRPKKEKREDPVRAAQKAAAAERTDLITDPEAPDQSWEG